MSDANPTERGTGSAFDGHLLPSRFAGSVIRPAAAQPAVAAKRSPALAVGILTAVAVIATITTLQLTSNAGYDSAEEQFRDAAMATGETLLSTEEAEADLSEIEQSATLLLESDTGALVDAAAKGDVEAATTTATEVLASADALLAEDVPVVGDRPLWFWELYAEASVLDEHRSEVETLDDRLRDETDRIDGAADALTESGTALLASMSAAAADHEAAHLSARNDDVIALRDAAATASAITAIDENAVTAFTSLQDAAAQVVASEQAELGEKAGPLMTTRLEIEAFARGLAPGVLLEFDWSPIVSGAGDGGSMGGLTTWWWDPPGRAVIELSHSVAEQWPSESAKALVAHEVGHAISVKCQGMYDASTQDSIEKWATAWAISMGFTDDGNGVWAYGYPPQSYIDAAYGCR